MSPLATGGMARIYIARSTGIGQFERHVVLKLITPERANDATAVQMFLDEARLAASLNHQNVAQVFEVGEDGGIHYLAMEYVHGQDLRALLARAGSQGTRVPLELALTVVAGASAGLHHAHERRGPDGTPLGIVHRDVSPSNLMVGYDGSVKLLDFGIAKAAARSFETQSGIIKGKFAYMAPEQCRGRGVDARSDVFSLGIILYEISTQHRCFRADSDFDTMHRIVTGDVVRPSRVVQNYPPALEAIVMKALAVEASQRYQSAGLLLEAVESFAVASRMSLSMMSLGRFMREMFGETPEPWLNTGRVPLQPQRENTISTTNSANRAPPLPGHTSGGTAPEIIVVNPSVLVLPRRASEGFAEDAVPFPDEAIENDELGVLDTVLVPASGPVQTMPMPSAPPPAAPAPTPVPLSPVMPVPTTQQGYAAAAQTGQSEVSFRADGAAVEDVRPSRRPLFIAGGILLVIATAIIAMTIGGSGGVVETPEPKPGAAAVPSAPETQPPAPPQTPAAPVVESIRIKVDSDPPGADVQLHGKSIGTTPLDKTIQRETGKSHLVVQRAQHYPVTIEVDLAADVSAAVPLKKIIEDDQAEQKRQVQVQVQADDERKKREKRAADQKRLDEQKRAIDQKRLDEQKRVADQKRLDEQRKKPKCQPAGQRNPFDTSCNGGPCPVCAEK